jgi:hypothetical protein
VPPDVRCYSRLLRACGVDDAAKRASVGASGGGGGGGGAEGMSLSTEVGENAGLSGELLAGVAEKVRNRIFCDAIF